jgi:hypothetical protein
LANISLGNNANMKGRPETAGLPMMGLWKKYKIINEKGLLQAFWQI